MLAFCRRKQRTFTVVMIIGALFGVFAFVAPGIAGAATSNETYGPWFPAPGKNGGGATAYQADISPFNDQNISEITDFACVLPDGKAISDEQKKIISQIYGAAGKVYEGSWDITSGDDYGFDGLSASDSDLQNMLASSSQGASSNTLPTDNGSYPSGQTGMDEFLKQEKELLQKGYWVYFHHRDIDPGDQSYQANHPEDYRLPDGIMVNVDQANIGEVGSTQDQRMIASLIDDTVRYPLELTKGLPQGCTLQNLTPPPPSFGGLFSNPGDQITNLLLYVPGKLASSAYDFIAPYAFKYTFWTPHSERGDVMWNVPDTCDPQVSGFSQAQTADACIGGAGGTPLGYSKSNRDVSNQSSWYLQIARFMQWLISGTYFLILFTAAVLFIFRGNRNQNLNLMRLFPRLILSIILTVFSGFAIGAVISFSNLLVQSIFSQNDVWTVGGVNAFLLQAGNIVGTGGSSITSGVVGGTFVPTSDFLSQLVQIIVGCCCIYFFTIFVVGSLLRQIVLIALIVLAPVAIFCLVNERWKHHFDRWIRCLLAVCFTPVVLALIFKLGMSINPLVLHPATSYGTLAGTLGLILMLATLWAMTRVIKSAKNFVMAHSGLGGMMQSAGGKVASKGGLLGAVDPRLGIAAAVAGGALAAKGADIERSGSLVPGSRAMGAGAGSPAGGYAGSAAAGTVAGAAASLGAGGRVSGASQPKGLLAAGATAMGQRVGGDAAGDQMAQWMAKRQQKSLAKKGISEITQSEYMRKLATAEAARRAGRDPIAAIGGEVYEDGNQYYFKDAGTGVDWAHGGQYWQQAAAGNPPVGELPAGSVGPSQGGDAPNSEEGSVGAPDVAQPTTRDAPGTSTPIQTTARTGVEVPAAGAPLAGQPVPSGSGGAPIPATETAAPPAPAPQQIEIPPARGRRDESRQAEMASALKQAAAASNRRTAAERVRESAQDVSGLRGTATNAPPTSSSGGSALPPQEVPAPPVPPNPTPPGPPRTPSPPSPAPGSRP